jgi:hypothetical protein
MVNALLQEMGMKNKTMWIQEVKVGAATLGLAGALFGAARVLEKPVFDYLCNREAACSAGKQASEEARQVLVQDPTDPENMVHATDLGPTIAP